MAHVLVFGTIWEFTIPAVASPHAFLLRTDNDAVLPGPAAIAALSGMPSG